MKHITVAAAIMIALLTTISRPASAASAAKSAFQQARFSHPLKIDNPYLPFVSGTTYIYKGTSDGELTYERFVVTADSKVVAGVTARVIEDKEWDGGQLAEKTLDWYAQDDAGNVWYLGEYSTQYENGQVAGHEGSWKAGTNGATAGIVMEAHPRIGDTYRQENAAGIAEDTATILRLDASVCVTFGCFSHLLKTRESSPLEPGVVEAKYYARGIGEIKSMLVKGGSEEAQLTRILKP